MNSAGVSGLSAEQQRRIEENRSRAREKLAIRKQQDKTNSVKSSQNQHLLPPPRLTATHSAEPHVRDGSGKHFTGRSQPDCSLTFKPSTSSNSSLTTRNQLTLGAVAAGNSVKYTELVRHTIKANLTLISRQRFEIIVPYDKLAIEVFKKTPSNMYSKSHTVCCTHVYTHDIYTVFSIHLICVCRR